MACSFTKKYSCVGMKHGTMHSTVEALSSEEALSTYGSSTDSIYSHFCEMALLDCFKNILLVPRST